MTLSESAKEASEGQNVMDRDRKNTENDKFTYSHVGSLILPYTEEFVGHTNPSRKLFSISVHFVAFHINCLGLFSSFFSITLSESKQEFKKKM